MSSDKSAEDDYQVDIPVVVDPDTAVDIRDDLEEDGRVQIVVETDSAPNVIDQIEWQLENDQTLLEFTEEYDG